MTIEATVARQTSGTAKPGNTLFAIINPTAGGCSADQVEAALHHACAAAGRSLDVYRSRAEDNIVTVARRAVEQGYGRLVVAGGDGTLSAVASALVGQELPLAVVPVGTANLLARELSLPLDLEPACRLAAAGEHCRQLDVMRFGERVFVARVSLGAYSRITAQTSAAAKRRFRQLAYVWYGLKEVFRRRSWRFELRVDDQLSYPRAAFIMVFNVGDMGAGALSWGPDTAPDDGRIDLCVVRARSVADYLQMAWSFIRGRHREARKVDFLHATRQVSISSRKSLPIRGDGEVIGGRRIDLEVLPGALPVVAPSAAERELGG